MLLKVQQASDINFLYIRGFCLLVFFKFWKPFSLNSNSNANHSFVARSVPFCGRLTQNSPARGSDGLTAKTGGERDAGLMPTGGRAGLPTP